MLNANFIELLQLWLEYFYEFQKWRGNGVNKEMKSFPYSTRPTEQIFRLFPFKVSFGIVESCSVLSLLTVCDESKGAVKLKEENGNRIAL